MDKSDGVRQIGTKEVHLIYLELNSNFLLSVHAAVWQ
jgi:hypothetical protein